MTWSCVCASQGPPFTPLQVSRNITNERGPIDGRPRYLPGHLQDRWILTTVPLIPSSKIGERGTNPEIEQWKSLLRRRVYGTNNVL